MLFGKSCSVHHLASHSVLLLFFNNARISVLMSIASTFKFKPVISPSSSQSGSVFIVSLGCRGLVQACIICCSCIHVFIVGSIAVVVISLPCLFLKISTSCLWSVVILASWANQYHWNFSIPWRTPCSPFYVAIFVLCAGKAFASKCGGS